MNHFVQNALIFFKNKKNLVIIPQSGGGLLKVFHEK